MNNSGLQIGIETEIILGLRPLLAAGAIPDVESFAKRLVTHYNGVSKETGLLKIHSDNGLGTNIEWLVTDD